ncbi:SDR family oxidoreductase [Deinococcus sp. YIM 134068]|uniref:SDR family oxidoreductase n=1 Tax=Deinococcus lichenicola TaxID=3118910 RepID=UPI002F93A246
MLDAVYLTCQTVRLSWRPSSRAQKPSGGWTSWNNAATNVPGPVVHLTVEDWDQVPSVDLRAPFLFAKAAFPHLQRGGGGTIVNVSSVAGKRGWA